MQLDEMWTRQVGWSNAAPDAEGLGRRGIESGSRRRRVCQVVEDRRGDARVSSGIKVADPHPCDEIG